MYFSAIIIIFLLVLLFSEVHGHYHGFVDHAFDNYKCCLSYLILFFSALSSTVLTLILPTLLTFSPWNVFAYYFICDFSESLCCNLIFFDLSEINFDKWYKV